MKGWIFTSILCQNEKLGDASQGGAFLLYRWIQQDTLIWKPLPTIFFALVTVSGNKPTRHFPRLILDEPGGSTLSHFTFYRKTQPADGTFSIFGIWFCNEASLFNLQYFEFFWHENCFFRENVMLCLWNSKISKRWSATKTMSISRH